MPALKGRVLLTHQSNQLADWDDGGPHKSSAEAPELLAAAGCVYSDENNFCSLVLLTGPTWRPPKPAANNNRRAGWDGMGGWERSYTQPSRQLAWGLWAHGAGDRIPWLQLKAGVRV